MTNDVTHYEPPEDDDGFSGSLRGFRGGNYLRWTAAKHWTDRDGLKPPSPLLVMMIDEVLKRWQGNVPTVISEKPLPDPEELNDEIPIAQWETGVDGKPRPPWAHYVVVHLVNVATGEHYTYSNCTTGAHIAVDNLREATIIMRGLRGEKVMPLVNLSERPMKTKFGETTRPHFEIINWKSPGGGGGKAIAEQPAPQLPAPAAATLAANATPPADKPVKANKPKQKSSKPAIELTANETLGAMKDVKPVTTSELLNDEIPF